MEAMEKLKAGQKFNEVASQHSEDKARQGVSTFIAYSQKLFRCIMVLCIHRFKLDL